MIRSRAISACSVLVLCGCSTSVAAKRSSPIEWGFGVQAIPTFDVGDDGNTSVHPVVGYNYLDRSDEGHDNIYQLGVQLRRSMTSRPMWYGGELVYDRFTDSNEDGAWNGFGLGGILGYELDTGFAPSSFFGSLSYMKYGGQDFEGIPGEGWDAWLFRVGFEVQPDLFNR